MRLCLTCYHMAPAGAPFCGHCGRSFGGRLCDKWHMSPPTARYCVHCRRTSLTDPTSYLPLGWVGPGITLFLLLIAAAVIWRAVGCPVEALLTHVLSLGIALFIFSLFLPAPIRVGLHKAATIILRLFVRAAGPALTWALRWLVAQFKAKP
jgi:hypothetical protein